MRRRRIKGLAADGAVLLKSGLMLVDPRKLNHLLDAARAVSPDCEIRFRGTVKDEEWVCTVSVGGAIIYESKPGTVEEIVDQATTKMKGVSKRMLAALSDPDDPPSGKKP